MSKFNSSEALFAFMATLKRRTKELTLGHDKWSENVPDLIFEFCIKYNLDPVRSGWEQLLNAPRALLSNVLGGGTKERLRKHSPDFMKMVDDCVKHGPKQINLGHEILIDDANADSLFDCLQYALQNKVQVLFVYNEDAKAVDRTNKGGGILKQLKPKLNGSK